VTNEWGVDLGCISCERLTSATDATCRAFPDKIPYLIVAGTFDHRKKFPNQKNNIIYKKREKE